MEAKMWSVPVIKQKIDKVVEAVTMLDKWADIEELTFPLEDPTPDEQIDWLQTYMIRLEQRLRDELESELL